MNKVYGRIDIHLAWQIFERRGMPPKLLGLLRDLHGGTQCALRGDHMVPPDNITILKAGWRSRQGSSKGMSMRLCYPTWLLIQWSDVSSQCWCHLEFDLVWEVH